MAYFPMFMDMSNLKVLVVGGGSIAAEKLEKLIAFTQQITVIATELSDETQKMIQSYHLCAYQRAYEVGDIKGFDIVIVATDTQVLHKEIYEESRGAGVLVNSVDNSAYCDFIFPSYIQREALTIAFSTGGASPAFSRYLRQYCETIIPDSVGLFLKKMKDLRTAMPKGKARMEYFDALVKSYFREHFK